MCSFKDVPTLMALAGFCLLFYFCFFNLRVVGGVLVILPGNFGKVFWLGSYSTQTTCTTSQATDKTCRHQQNTPSKSIRFHVLPYFSMCSLPALPNIWGAAGAATMPYRLIITSICLSIGLILSMYCKTKTKYGYSLLLLIC